MRACRELGIQTLSVYSEMMNNPSALQLADEAIALVQHQTATGADRILSAAEIADVDAIHPDMDFFRKCRIC